MTESTVQQKSVWIAILSVSFLPLLVKACVYIPHGRFLPSVLLCAFIGLIVLGMRHSPERGGSALKIWAIAMIAWAVIRLGLMILLQVDDIGEAHPGHQMNVWYVLISLLHLGLGVYIIQARDSAAGYLSTQEA